MWRKGYWAYIFNAIHIVWRSKIKSSFCGLQTQWCVNFIILDSRRVCWPQYPRCLDQNTSQIQILRDAEKGGAILEF